MSKTVSHATPFDSQQGFGTMLKDAINKVNEQQTISDSMTKKLIRGENVNLQDVMISAQKANITLNATLEVRNKMIEAYQEIMRMTV